MIAHFPTLLRRKALTLTVAVSAVSLAAAATVAAHGGDTTPEGGGWATERSTSRP